MTRRRTEKGNTELSKDQTIRVLLTKARTEKRHRMQHRAEDEAEH
jgi:hypothetical protein